MTGRRATWLVARRELSERIFEKSLLIGTGISILIILLVILLPSALGLGGEEEYSISPTDAGGAAIAEAATQVAGAFDAKVTIREDAAVADVDATVGSTGIRAQEDPDDELVEILQAANARVKSGEALRQAGLDDQQAQAALNPPALEVSTVEPAEDDDRGGLAFFAVLMLYSQLITIGYLVSMGVVQEKASRVVEVLLATLRPAHLLAGKVIGLGILGLGQLLLIAVIGLGAAAASGALDVDGDVVVAAALALGWFVVGYAFYGAAFACAASLVSRQEDLQSVLTPLSMLLLVAFFASFAALGDPDGTVAVVGSFLPPSAPMIMPLRIAVGEAGTVEIVAAFLVTIASAAVLIPLAARIYSGAILRTGAAVKLREAWRSA